MPANIVHHHFAERVYEENKEGISGLIKGKDDCFFAGAQGPDILLYLMFEKPPLNLFGNMQHDAFLQKELFKAGADYIKNGAPPSVYAFLLGQLCHYALDSAMHPYVYHREKDLPSFYPKNAHHIVHIIFESALDYLCIRDVLKKNTTFFPSAKNIKIRKKRELDICRYYADVLAPFFKINMTVKQGRKAFRYMKTLFRCTDDPTGMIKAFIRLIEKLFLKGKVQLSAFWRPRKERHSEDWLNNNRAPFPKYRNGKELSNETVEEIVSRSIPHAVALIKNFVAYIEGKEELDGGLYRTNYAGDLQTDAIHSESV